MLFHPSWMAFNGSEVLKLLHTPTLDSGTRAAQRGPSISCKPPSRASHAHAHTKACMHACTFAHACMHACRCMLSRILSTCKHARAKHSSAGIRAITSVHAVAAQRCRHSSVWQQTKVTLIIHPGSTAKGRGGARGRAGAAGACKNLPPGARAWRVQARSADTARFPAAAHLPCASGGARLHRHAPAAPVRQL